MTPQTKPAQHMMRLNTPLKIDPRRREAGVKRWRITWRDLRLGRTGVNTAFVDGRSQFQAVSRLAWDLRIRSGFNDGEWETVSVEEIAP